jgi:hypothetical protein
MNSTFKTFEPSKTQFFSEYDEWLKEVRGRRYNLIVVNGGCSAQDAMGTCRGYWAHTAKKGWMEK